MTLCCLCIYVHDAAGGREQSFNESEMGTSCEILVSWSSHSSAVILILDVIG